MQSIAASQEYFEVKYTTVCHASDWGVDAKDKLDCQTFKKRRTEITNVL